MAFLLPGHWQRKYWPNNYWNVYYWPGYSVRSSFLREIIERMEEEPSSSSESSSFSFSISSKSSSSLEIVEEYSLSLSYPDLIEKVIVDELYLIDEDLWLFEE